MKKKTSGCLTIVGAVLGAAGLLVLLLCIFGMVASEEEMDRNRELYSESQAAIDAYYSDSLMQTRHDEFNRQFAEAEAAGDSLRMAELQDSLDVYAPPMQAGHIGFNIAGAFLMIPAVVAFVVMALGVVLLCVGLANRKKQE